MNTKWNGYLCCFGLLLMGCGSVNAYTGPARADSEVAAIHGTTMINGPETRITGVDDNSFYQTEIAYVLPGPHTITVSCANHNYSVKYMTNGSASARGVFEAGQDYAITCDGAGAAITDSRTPRQNW